MNQMQTLLAATAWLACSSVWATPPADELVGSWQLLSPDPDACLPGWYCSYFGTYTVDAARGSWTTHVLGGNIPAYIGTDQSRAFTIRDGRLVIAENYMQGDRRVHAQRILMRAPSAVAPPEPSR